MNCITTWMRFLVWSTWSYLFSWFHCWWPSQTYCFVELMVCSKSKPQQMCGRVWLNSKLLTDIISMYSKLAKTSLNWITWYANGGNSINASDRLTRFTQHQPESFCNLVQPLFKEKEFSLLVHSGTRQPSEWMWGNRLLITGMTFQCPRSTNSGPWSDFNLFRLEQLDCSPH